MIAHRNPPYELLWVFLTVRSRRKRANGGAASCNCDCRKQQRRNQRRTGENSKRARKLPIKHVTALESRVERKAGAEENDSLVLDYDNDDHALRPDPSRDAGLSCRGPLGPPLSSNHTSTRSAILTMDPQVEDQQQQEIIVLKVSSPSWCLGSAFLTPS